MCFCSGPLQDFRSKDQGEDMATWQLSEQEITFRAAKFGKELETQCSVDGVEVRCRVVADRRCALSKELRHVNGDSVERPKSLEGTAPKEQQRQVRSWTSRGGGSVGVILTPFTYTSYLSPQSVVVQGLQC